MGALEVVVVVVGGTVVLVVVGTVVVGVVVVVGTVVLVVVGTVVVGVVVVGTTDAGDPEPPHPASNSVAATAIITLRMGPPLLCGAHHAPWRDLFYQRQARHPHPGASGWG